MKYTSANFRTDLFPLGGSIQIEISHLKYSSFLYAFRSPDYILLGLPVEDGKVKYVGNDSEVVFRFIDSGNVYGAQTYVLNTYTVPLPMMMLAYPDIIESISIRMSDRIDTCLPAVFTSTQVQKRRTGAVTNLSLGGVRFRYVGEGSTLGERGDLEIELPGLSSPVSMPATLKSVTAKGGDDGICFDKVVKDKSSPLHQYYATCRKLTHSDSE